MKKKILGLAKKSLDSNNNLISIDRQIKMMKAKPSSYGYGVIDVGNALEFANIKSRYIYFSHKDIIHINYKHNIVDSELSFVLSKIKEKVVLSMDYVDLYDPLTKKKSFILDFNQKIYILGISKNKLGNIFIDELSTLFYGKNINNKDLKTLLIKSISKGNSIYFNKKSNRFLSRFGMSTASVEEFIAYK